MQYQCGFGLSSSRQVVWGLNVFVSVSPRVKDTPLGKMGLGLGLGSSFQSGLSSAPPAPVGVGGFGSRQYHDPAMPTVDIKIQIMATVTRVSR